MAVGRLPLSIFQSGMQYRAGRHSGGDWWFFVEWHRLGTRVQGAGVQHRRGGGPAS